MRRWFAAALLLALALHAPAAPAQEACPAMRTVPLPMPRVREAVLANRPVTVVALGSSSTAGWHASDVAHSYPAVLQTLLNDALPRTHVAVLNRGVGGQDVAEMLDRLGTDVIALHPDLVIWQVGANAAMRRMPVEEFRARLMSGLQQLAAAKIDVVLMDNQRAPQVLASPEHEQFDQALAEAAKASGAALFARGALMERWRSAGYPYARFISDDGVHHNDTGYRCVAGALARAMVDGLALPAPARMMASRR